MSKPVYHRFHHQWAKGNNFHLHMAVAYMKADQRGEAKFALLLTLSRAMLLPLATAILPRLAVIFFRYMQPLLIRSVSDFVAQPVTEYTTNQGWGLTAAYGLVYVAMAVSSSSCCSSSEVWNSSTPSCTGLHCKHEFPFTDAG